MGVDGLKKPTIVLRHTPISADPEVSSRILKQTVGAVARQTIFGSEGVVKEVLPSKQLIPLPSSDP